VADVYSITGSYQSTPAVGVPSAIASVVAPIDESTTLVKKDYDTVSLDADGPQPLPFPSGMTVANVLNIKTTGGKVTVRVTSADGATQAFPVDPFLALICRSVGITAIDLTRIPGTPTVVDVFIGQITS
jgi:hypothetical protein